MILRDKYLKKLIASKNNGFPKVITGVRRCGKSYLLKEIYRSYLLKNGVLNKNIIVIELDDDKNVNLRNPLELGKHVRKLCERKRNCYVFIDEIQLVDTIINPIYTDGKIVFAKHGEEHTISFVDVILGLSREKNIDLYVTGSNSKMLSSDVITEFRDKATNIHLQPLSFEEYYNYVGGYKEEAMFDFIKYGGMPLAVLKPEEEKSEYLISLFKKTYFRDILEHNNIDKTEALDELCNVISDCVGELINNEKISNTFKSVKKENIDKDTVGKYINYFVDSFILSEVTRYDIKGKRKIGALRKYYFVDTGLRNARLNFSKFDEGHLIENLVYNELIYNGYTVNVGTYNRVEKNKNKESIKKTYEIDFYAIRGTEKLYIQIASDISNIETKEREIKPFKHINDGVKKVLVVNRPLKEINDDNGYTIIGLTDFLLRFIK
ncbi:MAG: ATP-binding protein [Erysipelotrichaceae bacterium]|nr:ATP-binding protein [Erysipelotrichaceae bacterium]